MKRLRVSENRRFLEWEDGSPFIWLGDTAWELFHRLRLEEAEAYLENRRTKGFTLVQAVALAELDGLETPNVYGEIPLLDNDPRKPNERYFAFVDSIITKADQLGIFVGLLPTWGDKVEKLNHGKGPVIFDPESARHYGEWIGRRYKNQSNLVWINGGDRSGGEANHPVWTALAEGIKSVDPNHLMTFHPLGGENGRSSSEWFHHAAWLDFNLAQSGHRKRDLPNFKLVARDYERIPIKPCLDGEPRYEDHPVDWKPLELGWFDDSDARQAAYWAVFSGAFGHTYGCHPVWQMYAAGREPVSYVRRSWREALDLPGAAQMLHLKRFLSTREFVWRVPDQSLIQPGEIPATDCENRAVRDEKNTRAWIYLPFGGKVAVNLERLEAKSLRAVWLDPRSGQTLPASEAWNSRSAQLSAPSAGRGQDWVLSLSDLDTHAAPAET